MPVYDYLCRTCGPFSAVRPMSEYQAPQPCGQCGVPAARALLTVPNFGAMDAGKRHAAAVNERSANAPRRSSQHPASCGCCGPRGKRLAADAPPKPVMQAPSKRPWMIGH